MVLLCEPCRSEAKAEAALAVVAATKSRWESPSLRPVYVHTNPEVKAALVSNASNNLCRACWNINNSGKDISMRMDAASEELRVRIPPGRGGNNNFAPCISIKGGGIIQKTRDGSLQILGPRGKYGISLDPKHSVMQLLGPPSGCATKLYGCNSHATFQTTSNNNNMWVASKPPPHHYIQTTCSSIISENCNGVNACISYPTILPTNSFLCEKWKMLVFSLRCSTPFFDIGFCKHVLHCLHHNWATNLCCGIDRKWRSPIYVGASSSSSISFSRGRIVCMSMQVWLWQPNAHNKFTCLTLLE